MKSACWNCGAAMPGRFCPACKALQPPSSDYFEFFEIPRHLALDTADLEKRFYALSRKLHPDLFSRKSAREQQYSLDASAVLNDAYRVLKEPVARAMYVLKQEGLDIGEQGTKEVPPELLEEVFELNMALEDEDAAPQVEEALHRFQAMRQEIDTALQMKFAVWDASHDAPSLGEVRALLNRRKYITNLIDKASHVPDRI